MLLSVHATVGAIIGENVNSPVLAFILAFISHYLLDVIPHGDTALVKAYRENFKQKAMIYLITFDIFSSIALFFILFFFHKITFSEPVLWGIVGGILPDIMVAIYEITNKYFRRLHRLHFWTHDRLNWTISLKLGLLVQIIIIYLLLR